MIALLSVIKYILINMLYTLYNKNAYMQNACVLLPVYSDSHSLDGTLKCIYAFKES